MLKVMPYRASLININGNDPFMNNVVSLMEFDAAPLADAVSGNTWSLNGAAVDNVTKKFGVGSGFFQGTVGALANNPLFALNGTDFTLDFFCYTSSSSPTDRYIFDNGSNNTFLLAVRGGNSIQMLVGGTWYSMGMTLPLNTWFHLAVCRFNGTLYAFLDGVLKYTHPSAFTGNISSSNNIRIGGTGAGAGYAFIGYIDEFRFTKGVARYLSSFPIVSNAFDKNPNSNIDGSYSYTTALLHGTGVNGGTTFTDVKGHILTRVGNTSLLTTSTENPRFSGASCLKFNQTTAPIQPTGLQFSSPSDFILTGDFTIEAWVCLKSFANSATVCDNIIWSTGKPSGSDATYDMRFEIGGDGTYKGRVSLRSLSTGYVALGSTVLAENVWYHVAICRVGTTCYVFVNGNLDGTGTSSAQWGHATNTVYLGMTAYDANTRFSGYMADFRITKGRSRYVRNFTPNINLMPEYPLGTVTAWENLTRPGYGIGNNHVVRIHGSGFLDVTSFSVNADSYVFTNVIVESDTSIVCTAPIWPWPHSVGLWHFKKPSASGNNTTWLAAASGSIASMPVGTNYN